MNEMSEVGTEKTPTQEAEPDTGSSVVAPQIQPQMQPFAAAVTLLMASTGHKHLFLTDLEWMLVPPLKLGQPHIPQAFAWSWDEEAAVRQSRAAPVSNDNKPMALVTQKFNEAFVSEEVEHPEPPACAPPIGNRAIPATSSTSSRRLAAAKRLSKCLKRDRWRTENSTVSSVIRKPEDQ